MNISDIKKLVAILDESDITEFSYEKEGAIIKVTRSPQQVMQVAAPVYVQQQEVAGTAAATHAAASVAEAAAVEDTTTPVPCPVVGTFYRRPSPDADAFVEVGKQVSKGDTLCIVEAMKVMNEVEAPCDGVIDKVLVTDGTVVEYEEVLFRIRPL